MPCRTGGLWGATLCCSRGQNQVALGEAEGWRNETISSGRHAGRRWLKRVASCSKMDGKGNEARREWQTDGRKELPFLRWSTGTWGS